MGCYGPSAFPPIIHYSSSTKEYAIYSVLCMSFDASWFRQKKQELIRRWDSERELLCSTPGRYPNSLK